MSELSEKVRATIRWLEDRESGEMIETYNYRRGYLGFPNVVAQEELDLVCQIINTSGILLEGGIGNSVGKVVASQIIRLR